MILPVANETFLRGNRLYLRPLNEVDCGEHYVGWLNDPDINRFLETRFMEPQSQQSVTEFVQAVNARINEFLFGIFTADQNKHIGNIKLGPISAHHMIGDVSLFIGAREEWGNGYAAEAIQLISTHGFATLRLRKLCASMYAPNEGSRKAFLKCGYSEEGRRPNHYLLDGEPCDLVLLGCFEQDLVQPAEGG